jgi:hypothetical protein
MKSIILLSTLCFAVSTLHAEVVVEPKPVQAGIMDPALQSILNTSGPSVFRVSVTLKPASNMDLERTRTIFLGFLAQLRASGETAEVLNQGPAPIAPEAPIGLKVSSKAVREVSGLEYIARIRLAQRGVPGTPVPPQDLLKTVAADALSRYSKNHAGDGDHVADGIKPAVKSTTRNGVTQILVVCDLFGGIAPIWHNHSITFVYDAQGHFISQSVI